MKSLIVHLHGERTGLLEQEDGDPLRFIYDPAWLAKPDAVPLSRSLPLQSEAFPAKKARPFFAGLLPEEEPRKIVAKILGISAANDFALLERIGGECAGAVQLLPADSGMPAPSAMPPRELSAAELEQIVAELPRRPLLAGRDGLRLSLAGAQDKLPVLIRDGCTYLPLDDLPSSHVLKPEPARFSTIGALQRTGRRRRPFRSGVPAHRRHVPLLPLQLVRDRLRRARERREQRVERGHHEQR